MATKTQINIRLSVQEKEILDQYCKQEDRQQSDVIREFVRSLKKKSDPTQRARSLRVAFHPPDESGRLSSSRAVLVGLGAFLYDF